MRQRREGAACLQARTLRHCGRHPPPPFALPARSFSRPTRLEDAVLIEGEELREAGESQRSGYPVEDFHGRARFAVLNPIEMLEGDFRQTRQFLLRQTGGVFFALDADQVSDCPADE